MTSPASILTADPQGSVWRRWDPHIHARVQSLLTIFVVPMRGRNFFQRSNGPSLLSARLA
jgi:hypothetical protein